MSSITQFSMILPSSSFQMVHVTERLLLAVPRQAQKLTCVGGLDLTERGRPVSVSKDDRIGGGPCPERHSRTAFANHP